MKKKILSLVLAFALILALVPSVTPSAQAANHNLDSADMLQHIINTAQSGDTITLTADINYNSLLAIKNTDININLNGYTLNIKSDMGALSVDNCKVEIYGGTLNIESTTNTALWVSGGAKITLTGNLKGETHGIFIPDRNGGGTVIVNGDVSSNNSAVTATDGGKVTVNGNLTGGYRGIWSDGRGTDVTVHGNVRVTGSNLDDSTFGVSARGGGTVTVNGDVTVSGSRLRNYGVFAAPFFGESGEKVTINGNLTVTGAKQTNWGVNADNSTVTISGDVTTGGAEVNFAVSAYLDAKVIIGGNVTGRVSRNQNSNISIDGNVIGEVNDGVTVKGTINGESQSTPDTEPPAEAPNLDTASGWAKEPLTAAIAKGFVPADLQDKYQDTITRAEFCRLAVSWV
ncbi:MAG: hypothetical protein FWG36_05530, partial [Oscillospiraceae bacterium]|nr:hypothetical protein [Oscillospiraceae bacterium]